MQLSEQNSHEQLGLALGPGLKISNFKTKKVDRKVDLGTEKTYHLYSF
jgi:hypothetical protein